MIDYKICIPSYQRSDQITQKTLSFLERHNIDPEKVYIFLSDPNEREVYEEVLSKTRYNKNIVIGAPGCGGNKNFICAYFPAGTNILCIDDDIEDIIYAPTKKKSFSITDFDELIRTGFQHCLISGFNLWGICAHHNPFYMEDVVSYSLKYIVGCFQGIIVQEHDDFLVRLCNHGEDIEYNIRQYIKNGGMVRLNGYGIITKYFGTGGLKEHRQQNGGYTELKKIQQMFPDYCSFNFKWHFDSIDFDGADLRLRDKTKSKKNKKV